MFKVASLNGNGANQTLLSMSNLVEGNIHGGIIDNTTGTKQNVTFIVGTVKFPLSVDANGTTPVSKINVPSDTTVQVNAPIGVNVSISYIETVADASAALTTIQGLVSEADTSATNAGISETNANNSAINANLSAENANESETNASNSEIMANKWAVNPENTEVLTGQFSAYHWARKAQAVASGDVIDDTEINDLLTWSSTKINSLDVANVKLSGDQTIDGIKTFSSSPIVPTPTAETQAANKGYVDGKPTLPIGAILNGYTIFDNCIVAFGGEFNRADYPKLWAYLQANPSLVKTEAQWTSESTANGGICGYFSSGNNSTTFRVPNLDKAFLRPDSRGIGTYQGDMLKSHSHAAGYYNVANSAINNAFANKTAYSPAYNAYPLSTVDIDSTGGGAETRPKNIAVLPLIVAK